jgi:prephenate dehydratase
MVLLKPLLLYCYSIVNCFIAFEKNFDIPVLPIQNQRNGTGSAGIDVLLIDVLLIDVLLVIQINVFLVILFAVQRYCVLKTLIQVPLLIKNGVDLKL